MKKALFYLSVIVLFGTGSLQAQNLYVRAGAGYAFPHAGQVSGMSTGTQTFLSYINGSLSTGGSSGTEFKIKKSSFSSGVYVRLAGGYMFTRNVGLDLEGSVNLAPNEHTFTTNTNSPGITYTTTYTQKAKTPVLLTPAIVLQAGPENVNVYTRVGIVLPLSTSTEENYTTRYNDSSNRTTAIKSELKTRFALGLSAALGAKWKIAKILSIWSEMSLLSMSLYARQSEITEYSTNGVNNISLLPQDQKTYRYEFSGNMNNTNTNRTYSVPFSNIALNIGISFDF